MLKEYDTEDIHYFGMIFKIDLFQGEKPTLTWHRRTLVGSFKREEDGA